MKVTAYVDGSCLANGKKGVDTPMGAGVRLILPDGTRLDKAVFYGNGTNQRAELLAISLAFRTIMEWAKADGKGYYFDEIDVDIRSDSKYAIGCLDDTSWNPKANLDLIHEAKLLRQNFTNVTFTWVKGHAGTDGNEAVDRLAVSASVQRLNSEPHPALTQETIVETDRRFSYLFDLGNSGSGPLGCCIRVTAASKEEAVALVKEHLPECIDEDSTPNLSISIYLNANHISVDDITEKEEVTYVDKTI